MQKAQINGKIKEHRSLIFWLGKIKEKIVMKTLKRFLAILLALTFVGTVLVGCTKTPADTSDKGENSGDPTDDTQRATNEYGEESFYSAIAVDELDFDGAELTVLVRDLKKCSREWFKESTEDELDEAVAMRNAAVEASLNVKMKYEMVPNAGYDDFANNFNGMITNDIISDMHYYDIAANYAYPGAYPSVRDFAANLLDDYTFPYFDFSLPCWNQAIVKNTTINDRLHYISGDLNLSMFDTAMVIWYNKTLYDAKKTDSDPENIQIHALEGLWTYEDLYVWTMVYEDSNGTQGKHADDTYGLSIDHSEPLGEANPHDAIPYAWDLELVLTDHDGLHFFNILGNTKAEEALVKFKNLVYAEVTLGNEGLVRWVNDYAVAKVIRYLKENQK